MFWVYILYSEKLRKFYIGQTENLENRLSYHNDNLRNRIWTKRGIPWELIAKKEFASRAESMKMESFIKRMKNKEYLTGLIKEWNENG
jgi:putative endonuclease